MSVLSLSHLSLPSFCLSTCPYQICLLADLLFWSHLFSLCQTCFCQIYQLSLPILTLSEFFPPNTVPIQPIYINLYSIFFPSHISLSFLPSNPTLSKSTHPPTHPRNPLPSNFPVTTFTYHILVLSFWIWCNSYIVSAPRPYFFNLFLRLFSTTGWLRMGWAGRLIFLYADVFWCFWAIHVAKDQLYFQFLT